MVKLAYYFPLDYYRHIEESDDWTVPLYTSATNGTSPNDVVSEYVNPKKCTNAMRRYFKGDEQPLLPQRRIYPLSIYDLAPLLSGKKVRYAQPLSTTDYDFLLPQSRGISFGTIVPTLILCCQTHGGS